MATRLIPALLTAFVACQADAAQSVYKVGAIEKIERTEPPYGSTPLEDKRQFNCDDFKLSDREIQFALKHAKPVSEKYFSDELLSVGCYGSAFVTFKNGDLVFFSIEPTGRIFAHVENGKLAGKRYYYDCQRCGYQLQPWGQALRAQPKTK